MLRAFVFSAALCVWCASETAASRQARGVAGPPATPTITQQTPLATPTATPEATPGAHRITGTILYYRGEHPVPDVTVDLAGAAPQQTTSDGGGAFALGEIGDGPWQLEPRKAGGGSFAISALDAAYALQYAAGVRPLDALQRLACDVTGNGAPTALDATRILEYAVGLRSEFQSSMLCGASWFFVPEPGGGGTPIPPTLDEGMCTRGAIGYAPLDGDRSQQDFRAVLIGDCTGNWPPADEPATLAGAEPTATVQLSPLRPLGGGRLRAALIVRTAAPLHAVEATLAIDPTQLQLIRARPALAAGDGLLLANEPTPGTVQIALAMNAPIEPGQRAIIVVELAPLTRAAARSRPTLTRIAFDE